MTCRAMVVTLLGAVALVAADPEVDRAIDRLEAAHADHFEHLDTMILLTSRVPAEGRSMLGYLDCLYHLAKASEKRLGNGLIEREFARLRCPKMSHFEFCPRRRAKSGFPVVGSHSERDSAELLRRQQKRAPPAIAGPQKTVLRQPECGAKGVKRQPEWGKFNDTGNVIGCRIGKLAGCWTLAARQGGLAPPHRA